MTSFSLYDTILVYVFQRATGAGAAVFPPGTARPERGVLSRNDPISMCERMRKNMNLKRSISLMILAGVLAASLASCAVSSDDPESTKGSSENPQYTYTNDGGNTPVTPTVDPEDVVYTPVNETVYVISENASFRLVSDTSQTAKFGLITEMTRTGYSSSWSKVQYEGAEYYVATSALTTDDLTGKTFTNCNKTKYVNVANVNVRKLASGEDAVSEILGTIVLDTEVKVTAESDKWSKVEVSIDGKTVTGFIRSEYLSDTKVNVEESEYLKYFTALDEPVTMYVSGVSTANLRQKPYADDNRGPLVEGVGKGLPEGTAVKVIAKGTVEEHDWCMVEWSVNGVPTKCYMSESCLSLTPGGQQATLDDMIKAYPGLVKYDSAMTLYTTGSLNGRSSPSFAKDSDGKDFNIVKSLNKADAVKAVAYGMLDTTDEDGTTFEMTWVLVEDEAVGFYFVSYRYLTPNSDGTPAPIPAKLEDLLEAYGFTETTLTIKTSESINAMSTPDSESVVKEIAEGTTLKVVAQGQTGDEFLKVKWFIVEHEDGLYFIVNDSNNYDIV